MPTYEYQCRGCGLHFERQHGMMESVDACPDCGSGVRKVMHAPGIAVRGSVRGGDACPMDSSMPACAPGAG